MEITERKLRNMKKAAPALRKATEAGVFTFSAFDVLGMTGVGAPVDEVTGAGVAGTGSIYVDRENGTLHLNTGTKAAPGWTAHNLDPTEADMLSGVTPGTIAEGKAVVADDDKNIGVVRATGLYLGVGGEEVELTATPDELNVLDDVTATTAELNDADVSARTQAITVAGAINVEARQVNITGPAESTYAVTLAAPSRPGVVKVITMVATTETCPVTLALTEVVGQSSGTSASFDAAGETLVLISNGSKWVVLAEVGVTLS